MNFASKHGTYRPNLPKLVASNSPEAIHKETQNAFATYDADNTQYAKAVTTLSKLKGIGPATASLLLSCYDSENVPFFSDELFRYLHWEDARSKGWDRKIGYTMKEYKAVYEKTTLLRERLGNECEKTVPAIEIEKAAYVLGRQGKSATRTRSVNNEHGKEEIDAGPPPPSKRRRR